MFYNTENRKKELFHPMEEGVVRMYTCGPTVYHFAHIGNFRTYVFEDVLRRTLKYFGFQVIQAMNLTDVDDKTIRGAIANELTLDQYTRPYKDAFFQDLHTLNIDPVEYYPAATDYIPQMIHIIQRLLERGIAYRGNDQSIYYAIGNFPRYGCLSHLKKEDLKENASQRMNQDEYEKDHIADFVLWKAYDPKRDGDIYWESPFGLGRPGWHIECSAMAMALLGETIDIHVGGVDNMFPHHENEIAQSEGYSGKRFVHLWMHSEHLLVDHKKMSKSLGNFFTLRDLLAKGYSGNQIRYLLLQTHYKTQLNFTLAGLEAAKVSLDRIQSFIHRLSEIQERSLSQEIDPLLEKIEHGFQTALADDLNVSEALGVLFEGIRQINTLCDTHQIGMDQAQKVLTLLKCCNQVLGVMSFETEEAPPELQKLLEERIVAREQKNWKRADELREEIYSQGYCIEDTAQGARLKKGSHV